VNFLNFLSTTDAQNVFNPLKGSIPPRTDADRSVYIPIAQSAMDDFGRDTLAGATNLTVKNADFINGLNVAMRQFALDRNVDTAINFLKNHYDQLQ
jgi:glucose/mannose transport system substrate-binding protein